MAIFLFSLVENLGIHPSGKKKVKKKKKAYQAGQEKCLFK